MTENDVKNQVKDWLDLNGFFHFHILQGIGSYKGTPDRIAMKRGVVLFIEIKRLGGRMSDYQEKFMLDCCLQNCHYIVARSCQDISNYLKVKGLDYLILEGL